MTLQRATPALPVADARAAAAFYRDRLGFEIRHGADAFAIVGRDGVEIHLWAADDRKWQTHPAGAGVSPVRSGAESFLAGTGSCRIAVDGRIDRLFAEMQAAGVLHHVSANGVQVSDHGTLEVNVLDGDGNLLTFFMPA